MVQDLQSAAAENALIDHSQQNGDIAHTSQDRIKLKKELGLLDGVAIIVGIIIGSGIFISPKLVLETAGSPGLSLVIWVLCGVLSMIGALCYAELGTSIPRSGGDYAYLYVAFGPLPAFLYLWCANIVFVPTTNAIMALTFAHYCIQPLFPGCLPPDGAVRLIAAAVLCFLTFLNCYNVKWTTRLQDCLMFFKIAALSIVIIAGMVRLGMGDTRNLQNAFEESKTDPGLIAISFYSGIFSYSGWNYLNYVTEELKEPYKNLPRAIGISMPIVTTIYVLANLAYFVVLSPEEMLSSNAVAVTFAEQLLGVMSWTMPLFVAGSVFGGLSVHIFASARLCFVGARQGHLPDSLALITLNTLSPAPALIFLCIISVIMLVINDIHILIKYTCFVESLFITMTVAGMLWMRWKRPTMERPIKVHLAFPISFFVMCGFLVCLPIYVSPREVGLGIIILLTGIPVYFIFVYWKKKPTKFQNFIVSCTVVIQKILVAVKQEGKND